MAAPHALPERKAAARRAALALRAALDPALGAALAAPILALVPPGARVAGFWPMGHEIDIRPVLRALAGRGQPLALPVTPPRGQPLRFRPWAWGDPLVPGPFGTSQPAGEGPAGEGPAGEGPAGERTVRPDVLLVPLLAFDRAGRRLGYGGGYYDRTLPLLPGALPIGCGFAAQELAEVPAGPEDVRLPWIATEAGLLACPEGAH